MTRSEMMKIRWQDAAYKEKQKQAHLGYVMPLEQREKIGLAMVGKNKGRKQNLTPERLEQLCQALLGKPSRNRGHHWHLSEETKAKISQGLTGNKSYKWKGDQVGYRALHIWVGKHLGKPRKCQNCGNDKLRHRQYHWANKSRTYKRVITDWIRLCVKCHMAFDRNQLALS